MSKPKWHEAWQEAFEDSYRDSSDALSCEPRKAVALRKEADGTTQVLGVKTGVEAERLIAEAQAAGLEVVQDREQVDQMIQQQGGTAGVPPEVYQVMNAVISFAQEVGAEWMSRDEEALAPRSEIQTEIEYTLEDVK